MVIVSFSWCTPPSIFLGMKLADITISSLIAKQQVQIHLIFSLFKLVPFWNCWCPYNICYWLKLTVGNLCFMVIVSFSWCCLPSIFLGMKLADITLSNLIAFSYMYTLKLKSTFQNSAKNRHFRSSNFGLTIANWEIMIKGF